MKITLGLMSLMMLTALVACGGRAPEKNFATPSNSPFQQNCGYLDKTSALKVLTEDDAKALNEKTVSLVSVTSISSQRVGRYSFQEVAGRLKVSNEDALNAEVLCSTAEQSTTTLENEVAISAPRTLMIDNGSQVESAASEITVASVTLKRTEDDKAGVSDATTETKSGFKTLSAWTKSLEAAKISYFRSGEDRLVVHVISKSDISQRTDIYEYKLN